MFRRVIIILVVLLVVGGCKGTSSDNTDNPGGTPAGGANPAKTPSGGADSASFVAFGDWGTGGDDQKAVAREIGQYCGGETCEFILTLGDNFYSDGVSSTDDGQWKTKYHDIYDSLGLPFYASLGNHDHNGDIQAEIDYSTIGPDWHMPAEDYSFVWPAGSSSPVVEFFIFDSNYPHFRDKTVQSWLSDAIAKSTATWKILVMHHPIYSNGDHGDDEQGNNQYLLPIICDKIDLVLSGHDHDFAYLQSSEDGCPINQLVIGTGGANNRGVKTDDPRVVSTASVHGFGWFQVTSSELDFRMVETDGTVFYSTTFKK